MLARKPNLRKVSQSILPLVSILILLGSTGTSEASIYYFLTKESQVTVSSPKVILQNGTTGTSTIYTNNTSAEVSVTASNWLGGWDKRVKITVNSSDIDGILTDFPILIYLSNSSSGENDEDMSHIFDELQNNSNRKKIAITTSDSITQCYVEIDRWDNASEQAWLWVKVPSVSNTTNTDLYLYYDKDHIDNTVYVGDTGSTAALNVWDSSFKGVWHLGETSGGVGAIKDSTSNNNVGTDNGSPTFNATGMIDSAISFDGFDDYINMSNSASLQFTSSLTIEGWINLQSFGAGSDVDIVLRKGEGNPNDYQLAIHDQKLALMIEENDDAGLESSANLTATTWYYLAGIWNGSIRRVYLNGSEDGSGSKTGSITPDIRDIYIGGRSGTDLSTGVIDEVRASNTTRSAAWIKASYESGRDDLVDFGLQKIRSFWSAEYNYRKQITIANNVASTLGSGYTVLLMLDTASLVSLGKVLSNGNDLRIVHWNGSSWVEIDRDIIDMNTNSTQIWFKTQAGIGSYETDINYYMYYGNPSAENPPENRSNVYLWFDDFSTNTTSSYDVDRHADSWHGASNNTYKPYWDSANNAVYFDTGDNYAGDWMPNAVNETNVYAEMKMNITGSYLSNTTNGILLRWQNSSTFYGGHISGGSYLSPCIVKNGRTTYIANMTPSEYHVWNQWFTFAVAVYGSDLKLWVDGVQKVNGTDTQITTSGKISFVVGQSIGWMDDFKIRKYVEPEPSTQTSPESARWYNSNWNCRKKITINHTKVEANLNDFPILVNITDTELRDYAQSDGDDILFAASDGTTKLSHEIEMFNGTTGQLVAWVKANISATISTILYVYFDNPSASNQENIPDVWSNGYVAVWHLNGDFQDSTSNNHTGTNFGSLDAASMMARGREFNPDDGEDYLDFGDWNVTGNKITIQTWVKCDDFGQDDPRFITKALSGSADQHVFMLGLSGSGERYLRTRIRTGTTTTTLIAGTGGDLTANTWYLVAATYDGDDSPNNIKLFRNGVEPTSYSSGSQSRTGDLVQNTWPIWSGDNPNTASYGEADGQIDEIRISNVARSPSWLETEYNNQYNSSSFHSIGNKEEKPIIEYDYVLRVNNTVASSWEIRLKRYSNSSTGRLQNCTIYFHNSTDGTSSQIVIENGAFINETGAWYDLGNLETIYIAMTVEANSTGTSYVRTYLEIRFPGTTTYLQYKIAFEIT